MMRVTLLFALASCYREPAPAPAVTPTPSEPTPAPTQPAPAVSVDEIDRCAADSDCVVTNFAGCCACPQCSVGEPTARTTKALAHATQQCQVVRCDGTRCQTAGACPPGESADLFTPVCRDSVCVAVRK